MSFHGYDTVSSNKTIDAADRPANPKYFSEPLTVELLQKHQKMVKGE